MGHAANHSANTADTPLLFRLGIRNKCPNFGQVFKYKGALTTPLLSASSYIVISPTQFFNLKAPMVGRRTGNVNKRCLNCALKRGREEYHSPGDCPSEKKKKRNPCTIFDLAVF